MLLKVNKMEIELKSQVEKQFFDRQEYVFEVKQGTTPSYEELKLWISKKLNVNADLVIIKGVEHQFGTSAVVVKAYVYKTPEALKKYEDIKEEKVEKKAGEGEKPEAAPQA